MFVEDEAEEAGRGEGEGDRGVHEVTMSLGQERLHTTPRMFDHLSTKLEETNQNGKHWEDGWRRSLPLRSRFCEALNVKR